MFTWVISKKYFVEFVLNGKIKLSETIFGPKTFWLQRSQLKNFCVILATRQTKTWSGLYTWFFGEISAYKASTKQCSIWLESYRKMPQLLRIRFCLRIHTIAISLVSNRIFTLENCTSKTVGLCPTRFDTFHVFHGFPRLVYRCLTQTTRVQKNMIISVHSSSIKNRAMSRH